MQDTFHQLEIGMLDLTDAYYSAIGRFLVEFSTLETILRDQIGAEAGLKLHQHEKILVYDFSLLCTVASHVLATDRSEEQLRKLKAMISEARELNDHRVRIAHGAWSVTSGKTGTYHTSRQKLAAVLHYETPAEIAVLADKTSMLSIRFLSM